MQTARRRGRYGHRDATMILVPTAMDSGWLTVPDDGISRLEAGIVARAAAQAGPAKCSSVAGAGVGALRRMQRDMPSASYVFTTERGSPTPSAGFRKMLARTGDACPGVSRPSPHAAPCVRL